MGLQRVLPWLIGAVLWVEAADYRLGEGLQLWKTPLYLGGYVSLYYGNDFKANSEAVLEEAALMLYGAKGSWDFMTELEIRDAYVRRWGEEAGEHTDAAVHAERMYVRYEPVCWFRATAGKFNSPVGFWNLMPINALRDTTSNPKVARKIFPRFTTGGEIDLTGKSLLELSLIGQASRDLDAVFHPDRVYNNFDIDRHFGAGLYLPARQWSFRLNAGEYRIWNREQVWRYGYAGADYELERFRMLAEIGYRKSDRQSLSTFGAYWQGTYEAAPKHFGVLRLETITEYTEVSEDTFAVFGYTYRPRYPIALKAEYQRHSRENEDVVLCSFSVLF